MKRVYARDPDTLKMEWREATEEEIAHAQERDVKTAALKAAEQAKHAIAEERRLFRERLADVFYEIKKGTRTKPKTFDEVLDILLSL